MSPSQIIVLATPVFLLLIAIEFAWGYAKGRNTYRLSDAIYSISLGVLSQISAVFTRLLRIGIYSAIYAWVALYPNPEFWNTWSKSTTSVPPSAARAGTVEKDATAVAASMADLNILVIRTGFPR